MFKVWLRVKRYRVIWCCSHKNQLYSIADPSKASISTLFQPPTLQQNHPQTTRSWQPPNTETTYHFHAFRNTAINALTYSTTQMALLCIRCNPTTYNVEQRYILHGTTLHITWNQVTHDMEHHK